MFKYILTVYKDAVESYVAVFKEDKVEDLLDHLQFIQYKGYIWEYQKVNDGI